MFNPTETRQFAMAAMQIMQRAQITGADVDNYTAVRNWLTMVANGNLILMPVDAEKGKEESQAGPVAPQHKLPLDPLAAAKQQNAANKK